MKTCWLFFTLLFISTVCNGAVFSNIQLNGWKKENLSKNHLRFTNPHKKEMAIHLQIESYDNKKFWNKRTLASDIKKMEDQRKFMSNLLGITDYRIIKYSFEIISTSLPRSSLDLNGSYNTPDGKRVTFREMNYYYNENFLQLKLINENNQLDEKKISQIIKEINVEELEIH